MTRASEQSIHITLISKDKVGNEKWMAYQAGVKVIAGSPERALEELLETTRSLRAS